MLQLLMLMWLELRQKCQLSCVSDLLQSNSMACKAPEVFLEILTAFVKGRLMNLLRHVALHCPFHSVHNCLQTSQSSLRATIYHNSTSIFGCIDTYVRRHWGKHHFMQHT